MCTTLKDHEVSFQAKFVRPVKIKPLLLETEEERKLYEAGERNSKRKKELGKTSLLKHTPNDEESDLIHALWQKQLQWHGKLEQIFCPSPYIPNDKCKIIYYSCPFVVDHRN